MILKINKSTLYISSAMPKLKFEKLDVSTLTVNTIINRAKIPGGWLLVSTSNAGGGVTFYPDPEHKWDGGSAAERGKTALAAPRAS